jgi:spermidine synthase
MSLPWKTIDRVSTEEGLMELRQRGEGDFLMTIGGRVLMNSMAHRSEIALGRLACSAIRRRSRPSVLLGGLGMGYTLRAVLDGLPASGSVVVAELNPIVIDWCKGPLSILTADATGDPRVTLVPGDVSPVIERYALDPGPGKLDAIVLDLYSGPSGGDHKRDHPLYGSVAIDRVRRALKAGGVFAVWGEDRDDGFHRRLTQGGFSVSGGKISGGGPRHAVYLGKKIPASGGGPGA